MPGWQWVAAVEVVEDLDKHSMSVLVGTSASGQTDRVKLVRAFGAGPSGHFVD